MSNSVNIYFYNLQDKKLFGIYSKFEEYDWYRNPKKAENIYYRTECPFFGKAQWRLGPTTKLEKTILTSDIICKFEASPNQSEVLYFTGWKWQDSPQLLYLPLWFIARRKYRIKLGMGENAYSRVQENYQGQSFHFLFPMKSGHITLLELICDNMHGILPTRGIHMSFGVQRFYWGIIM